MKEPLVMAPTCEVSAAARPAQGASGTVDGLHLPTHEDRECPVFWLLRLRIERGPTVATVEEWSVAGSLSIKLLLAAIDAGALEVVGGVPRRATRTDRVTSESLLTLLSRELMYASQLECPPAWRRTLPASVKMRSRKGGQHSTRTRPVTVACKGGRAA